jgi:hypothetical protein
MSPLEVRRVCASQYFGTAWAELESRSAVVKRKVLVTDLDNQTEQAQMILDLYARCARLIPARTQVSEDTLELMRIDAC